MSEEKLPDEVWRGEVMLPFGDVAHLCAVVTNSEGGIVVRRFDVDAWPVVRAEFDKAAVLISWALAERAARVQAEAFVRDCRDNWDCDPDAHRYGTTCRACEAAKVLGPKARAC